MPMFECCRPATIRDTVHVHLVRAFVEAGVHVEPGLPMAEVRRVEVMGPYVFHVLGVASTRKNPRMSAPSGDIAGQLFQH